MDKILKIGYFADGKWSHLAFEKIVKDPTIEIAFITPRYDTQDKTLKDFCKDYGIEYLIFKNVNAKESISKIKSYNCDLLVSMSFNQIFKREIIDLTPFGIINCHAGKLPFYRGRNVLNWVLINDENEFGITVHFVNEGIDTGDIILQETYGITEKDNYNTLLEVSYEKCAELLYKALILIKENNYKRIPQSEIHPHGTYCGIRQLGDEYIDWSFTSRELHSFIRALTYPGPCAIGFIDGSQVKIIETEWLEDIPEYKGILGQIIGTFEDGFIVKTSDTYLKVRKYESDFKIRVGMRFDR